ncbi:hypothetical protein IWZ00DRAFT_500320 [Phyllosticta capitalensis]|uniref:C3H1-type domain-containing protein n=1 Tax=Phyllosticta capitalensis TaxID=121624 RepID=A0ABR1YY41_9PEZI
MTICRYFQQGNCRFGERCKFEHPGQVTQARPPQQNQNRYGALNNPFGGGAARAPARNGQNNKYNLDTDVIKTDLTTDRPIWPFSAYGPVKGIPRQLIEGPVEQSPEEVRFRFYALGNPQQGAAEETALLNETNQQIQSILNDLNGAVRFICDGDNVHPNRNDICEQNSASQTTGNTFARGSGGISGQQPPTGPSAFGGANKPAFGAPSFGQPGGGQQPQSAFGAPSAPSSFGQQANQGSSAFGAPSSLGAANNSAFGKPSGFGAPAFGQPANANPAQSQNQGMSFGAPAFGQPGGQNQTQNAAAPAFGQASQPNTAAPAFGQPSQPSTFGQPAGGAFGRPAFGQPGGGAGGGGAFGQATPAAPAAPAAASGGGVFGKPATAPFGQPAFGQAARPQSGAFGAAPPAASPFGNPQQPQQPTPSPFGQQPTELHRGDPFKAAGTPNTPMGTGAFGQPQPPQQPPTANGTTTTLTPAAPSQHKFTLDASGTRLATWKGRRVEYLNNIPYYRDASGSLIRIWHATPPAEKNPFHEAPPEAYEGDAGRELEGAYVHLRETGTWRDGVVPETPPKMEWIGWDV